MVSVEICSMDDILQQLFLSLSLSVQAYYPVYENRREEYVNNFWRLVNWPVVSQLYTEGQTKRSDL